MIEVIKQLFVNATILISALFILGQKFINKPLKYGSCTKIILIEGVMTGFTGSILVTFGLQVTESIVVDFRYISLIVSSIYGGTVRWLQ